MSFLTAKSKSCGGLIEIMKSNSLVVVDPDILGGQPVFAGTRVPIETLIDHLQADVTLDEFLDDFPTVSRLQALAIIKLYPQHFNNL